VRKFHGVKVLGTFAPKERKFQGCDSYMERKFLDFSLPGNESAEERKGQIPTLVVSCAVLRYLDRQATAKMASLNCDEQTVT